MGPMEILNRSSHRRCRLALLLLLSLILTLTKGPVVGAVRKTPSLSREKKTLIAGSAFRLKVKRNTADKIISTRWSVNTQATGTLSLTETSRTHAVVSTVKGANIPQYKARVTAKVDYQAGKKLKTRKLVCVVTVKTTTTTPVATATPAPKTPAPTATTAPATRTPAATTTPAPTVTPPAVTPPRSSSSPTVSPSGDDVESERSGEL